MPKPQRQIYVLRLRPLPRVDGIKALRRGLKMLLRQCGLQCLEVKLETPKEESQCREHAKQIIAEQKKQAERDPRPKAGAVRRRRQAGATRPS